MSLLNLFRRKPSPSEAARQLSERAPHVRNAREQRKAMMMKAAAIRKSRGLPPHPALGGGN